MLHRTVLGSLATLVIFATGGFAQDEGLLSQWYGSGVHAYFSGNTTRALQDFGQAVDGGTKDPRVYYFRALTYEKMGHRDAAEIDMATGAALETQDRDGRYPVSRSLERIQGQQRLALEKYRRTARISNYQRQLVRRRQRYEALRRQEQQVLRRQIAVPLDRLAVPVVATTPIQQPVPPVATPDARPLPPAVVDQPVAGKTGPDILPPAAVQPPIPAAAPSGFAEPPQQQPTTPAPAPVQPVAEGDRVGVGSLGRILTRVIGKALPDAEGSAASGQTRDPFGDESLPAEAPPTPAPADSDTPDADNLFQDDAPAAGPAPTASPATPVDSAGSADPEDLFDSDPVEPAAQPAPADNGQPADPSDDARDPFGDDEPTDGPEPAPMDDVGAGGDANGRVGGNDPDQGNSFADE